MPHRVHYYFKRLSQSSVICVEISIFWGATPKSWTKPRKDLPAVKSLLITKALEPSLVHLSERLKLMRRKRIMIILHFCNCLICYFGLRLFAVLKQIVRVSV